MRRPPISTSPYTVNCDTSSTAPCTSASARFILPSASPNTRSPSSLSAIQARASSLSDGANPASTRSPTPIFPVTRPSTRTSARETRCTTTLTGRFWRSVEAGGGRGRLIRAGTTSTNLHHPPQPPPSSCSLHRHRLRQIPRLVHIAPPPHRDVVREQLQRQHSEHRRQEIERLGNLDLLVGELREPRIPLGHDRDHPAAAGLHLLHVGYDLLVDGVLRREEDDRHEIVDQGDRAVLHLGRGIALRLEVGNLLELEGALERHRKVVAPPEVEHLARPRDALGDALHLGRLRQDPLHQLGEPGQSAHHR